MFFRVLVGLMASSYIAIDVVRSAYDRRIFFVERRTSTDLFHGHYREFASFRGFSVALTFLFAACKSLLSPGINEFEFLNLSTRTRR